MSWLPHSWKAGAATALMDQEWVDVVLACCSTRWQFKLVAGTEWSHVPTPWYGQDTARGSTTSHRCWVGPSDDNRRRWRRLHWSLNPAECRRRPGTALSQQVLRRPTPRRSAEDHPAATASTTAGPRRTTTQPRQDTQGDVLGPAAGWSRCPSSWRQQDTRPTPLKHQH